LQTDLLMRNHFCLALETPERHPTRPSSSEKRA
jgi:hypothetical protein